MANMELELDFKKVNLYEILEIEQSSTETDIRKAYRKKALTYHPDKNRDNPKAKEVFQQLSKVLEILADPEARASYDKLLNSRKEREIRNRHLDARRRQFRDVLEKKEKAAGEDFDAQAEEDHLKREIERIRKQGSSQLEEENQILKEKLAEEKANQKARLAEDNHNRIKIRKQSNDILFDEASLTEQFKQFGVINFIFVADRSAIIEYEHSHSLQLSKQQCPTGLEVEILSEKIDDLKKKNKNADDNDGEERVDLET